MKKSVFIALAIMVLVLQGCGTKGNLYLPDVNNIKN